MMAPEAFEAEVPASVRPNLVRPAANDGMGGMTADRPPLVWPHTSQHAQGQAQEPIDEDAEASNASNADSAADGERWHESDCGRGQADMDDPDDRCRCRMPHPPIISTRRLVVKINFHGNPRRLTTQSLLKRWLCYCHIYHWSELNR